LQTQCILLDDGSASVSTDWYATFRGRVGYAFGPALLYVKTSFDIARVGFNYGF